MSDTNARQTTEGHGSLTILAILSLLAGALAGLLGGMFRLSLEEANHGRDRLIAWVHENAGAGLGLTLIIVLCAGATALAAWLVRRYAPDAQGSGIPHVEAVLNRELPPAPLRLIPVKFVGGLLAIGSGLALGREGPTVQLGATIAELTGRAFRLSSADCRLLLASGAGAGLATAFNAPLAGAIFVLEELVRRFDARTMMVTLGASVAAIGVSRLLLGHAPDFDVAPLPFPGYGTMPTFLVLGLIAGLLGTLYNRAILGALAIAGRWQVAVELRAAVVGAAIGMLAWYAPHVVGGGDPITQHALMGTTAIAFLPWFFMLRFALGAISYAAGTPGGLFAPMLVLGAQLGLGFGIICTRWLPFVGTETTPYALVGMASFFTAVVRAPLTGMILVIELTSNYTQILPMLAACFTAMLVPTMVGSSPIYDSLRPSSIPASSRK